MSLFDNRMKQLRAVAWIEGISYLVLLFIAMPMKYFGGQPEMVRIVGMIHGLLFVLFTIVAFQAKIEYSWTGRRFMRVFLTSFIPFGMVMFDRMVHAPEESRG
jgi:integral membrane protein